MKVAGEVSFRDLASSDDALASVRYDADRVAVCISLRAGDEIEFELSKEDARKLAAALCAALD